MKQPIIRISVDAMGGDNGCLAAVQGAVIALRRTPNLYIDLVGHTTVLKNHLARVPTKILKRIELIEAEDVIEMEDDPITALRVKKRSSMRVALERVRDGFASACVSSGNTGALVGLSRFILRMLPTLERPAIVAELPTIHGRCLMLDLGANAHCSARHLVQFAWIGSVLSQAFYNNTKPRVALLNIGAEAHKGNDGVRQAAQSLSQFPNLNYIGFIEGHSIYQDVADVIVCDGFVGNVALKTSEGLAKMFFSLVKEEFQGSWFRRFLGWLVTPMLRKIGRRCDPRTYNGASLAGLNGIVVKSHGGADKIALSNAITAAVQEVKKDIPGCLRDKLHELAEQSDNLIE